MSEALWAIRPTGEQAVESPPKSVHAQEQLERTAQGYEVELQRDTQAVLVTAATGSASSPSAKQSRCSFCRAELDQSLKLTIPGSRLSGQRGPTGLFCSTHCRNCVLALAALHPSPLASDDFLIKRALLTDGLLDLWRRGQGPDPALVLEAAKRASCGLPSTAVPAALTGTHTGAQAHPLATSPAYPVSSLSTASGEALTAGRSSGGYEPLARPSVPHPSATSARPCCSSTS